MSCGSKTPLSEENKIYAGKWVASDETWLQIYNNGGGDFKKSNSNVTGGSATFTEGQIEIGLFGLGSTYKIDTPPHEEKGQMTMVLDDVVYWRSNN